MTTAHDHNKTSEKNSAFQELYLGLRSTEKRVLSDAEVKMLPDVSKGQSYSREWKIRKASSQRLMHYLSAKNCSLKILEVGCGNGWLSHQLSKIRYSNVVGLDINEPELNQAERVFGDITNLNFFHGDLVSSLLEYESFDIVIFAASIQYFRSLTEIIETSLDRLKPGGEIHIIDSHFYHQLDIHEARTRSRTYFQSNGFEGMKDFYFHHSLEELQAFEPIFINKRFSIVDKLFNKKHPFPWICISK